MVRVAEDGVETDVIELLCGEGFDGCLGGNGNESRCFDLPVRGRDYAGSGFGVGFLVEDGVGEGLCLFFCICLRSTFLSCIFFHLRNCSNASSWKPM